MRNARRELVSGLLSLAVACGGTVESSLPDAGLDATLVEASSDTAVASDALPLPDSTIVDAGGDAPDDAACSINVVAVASCEVEAGYFCFDYVGNGWTASNLATTCRADAGYTLVWDAGCPTTGRVGSCGLGQGSYEFVERCYPPFSSNQCQGFCLIADGGYCPN